VALNCVGVDCFILGSCSVTLVLDSGCFSTTALVVVPMLSSRV
ncbi:hypothetical protein A2U01_0088835, partial [Trifolium medium]|nr:hypothetical protein [Trifolium medium]